MAGFDDVVLLDGVARMELLVGRVACRVPAVVGGDFNSADRSGPYRALTGAGFTDPQRDAGRGPGFTWPDGDGWGPLIRIDWLLIRGLDAVDAFVTSGGGSDVVSDDLVVAAAQLLQ